MLTVLTQARGRARTMLLALGLGLSALPAMAQDTAVPVPDDVKPYRDQLQTCLDKEDYVCAFDTLMDYGTRAQDSRYVVSARAGATLFGLQTFVVLEKAKDTLPPEQVIDLTSRAIAHAYDTQPNVPYASGPFLLLHGEVCRKLEDANCTQQAAFALQLMLQQNQWYLPSYGDGQGEKNVKARAEAFVKDILG